MKILQCNLHSLKKKLPVDPRTQAAESRSPSPCIQMKLPTTNSTKKKKKKRGLDGKNIFFPSLSQPYHFQCQAKLESRKAGLFWSAELRDYHRYKYPAA